MSEGVGGVRDVLGAGRDCRYTGARRGIGLHKGECGDPRGYRGCWRAVRRASGM